MGISDVLDDFSPNEREIIQALPEYCELVRIRGEMSRIFHETGQLNCPEILFLDRQLDKAGGALLAVLHNTFPETYKKQDAAHTAPHDPATPS